MKYHNITKEDMNNGDGLRVVLWVSGCDNYCKGCQNQITWDPNDGIEFDEDAKKEIYEELDKDYISGITFSGGDPFYHSNMPTVLEFIKEIKSKYPDKTIWVYTGSDIEQDLTNLTKHFDNETMKAMRLIDVIVDGKYVEELRDITIKWRGSSNQKVIDFKKTLNQGKIILYCK